MDMGMDTLKSIHGLSVHMPSLNIVVRPSPLNLVTKVYFHIVFRIKWTNSNSFTESSHGNTISKALYLVIIGLSETLRLRFISQSRVSMIGNMISNIAIYG
jgi:hypothetical protein